MQPSAKERWWRQVGKRTPEKNRGDETRIACAYLQSRDIPSPALWSEFYTQPNAPEGKSSCKARGDIKVEAGTCFASLGFLDVADLCFRSECAPLARSDRSWRVCTPPPLSRVNH